MASVASTTTACSSGHALTKMKYSHQNHTCDLCQNEVVVNGWRCAKGCDWDACETCYSQNNEKPVETTRDCSICMETFPTTSLHLPSSQCEHEPVACDNCLRHHVAEEVNGKGITREINCPLSTCGKTLEHHEIHRICRDSIFGRLTFDRFDNLLFRRTVEQMPEFVWCTGKNCGSGQIHAGGTDTPIVRCTACSSKTCFLHKSAYHDGLSCTDYDAQLAEAEAASGIGLVEAWLQRSTKPCPNCSTPIEKNEGCCHMTCANVAERCEHEFCWHCLAPWKDGMLGKRGAHHHLKTCCRYMEKE
jgi:E3 ubiquitin-protein ligase RNF14